MPSRPPTGTRGSTSTELGEELRAAGADPEDVDELSRLGVERMRGRIEETLKRFRVNFDTWSSERALHSSNALWSEPSSDLAERGHTYRSDGALWLRTSTWGDDKDRVLIRSDGEPTYFAADIAYHRDKLERGAEQMIVPLGADHHGYVPRMKAAVGMLSGDPGRYEAPIMQLVNIIEGGERARMSKRKGDFVSLDELMDDIGVDAARFFLLQRSHDTVIDLDLELARSQSQENPVYYVQYAHARIAGIIAKAVAEGSAADEGAISSAISEQRVGDAACEPSERALIRRVLELPSRGARGGGKTSPPSHLGLRDRGCGGLPRFLSRLPRGGCGRRGRHRGARGSAARRLPRDASVSSRRVWTCSGSKLPSGCRRLARACAVLTRC